MEIKLRKPIEFGKQTIESLTLVPNGRAARDMSVQISDDGSMRLEPWKFSVVGLKMAGHIASAEALADKLDPADMLEISQAVLGFFVGSPTAGSAG